MRIILLIAVAASFLAGCSGQDPISDEAASKIAALSQDSHKHQEAFAGAIQELSTEKGCQVDHVTLRHGGVPLVGGLFGDYQSSRYAASCQILKHQF